MDFWEKWAFLNEVARADLREDDDGEGGEEEDGGEKDSCCTNQDNKAALAYQDMYNIAPKEQASAEA